jgi:hypothetical protein
MPPKKPAVSKKSIEKTAVSSRSIRSSILSSSIVAARTVAAAYVMCGIHNLNVQARVTEDKYVLTELPCFAFVGQQPARRSAGQHFLEFK